MASQKLLAAVLLVALTLPSVLAGNAAGAEQSSQSNYQYDSNGNIILSPAGNNNHNGNGEGTATTVIDWYNDQEYPTCPLQACPALKYHCSGGMCNDTAGILGRWRLDNNNGYRIKYNCSRVGGSCPYTKNDPHFQGAQGTRFEFNGAPEKTFCLLTDRNIHVNMQMRGYYDSRTVGATVLRNGKAVRTWIRALGFVWRAAAVEAEHKFRLVARAGKQQERGDGPR
ncbi:hypothetical protein CLOM_g23557 [Closterium sp. NIES-68]|nr:hypothetical protein CLOM_g23557 [Closterium sp. NIES-68]